jgi:hypothetical protein
MVIGWWTGSKFVTMKKTVFEAILLRFAMIHVKLADEAE